MGELSSKGWHEDTVGRLHRWAREWSRKARFVDWQRVEEKDKRRRLAMSGGNAWQMNLGLEAVDV